MDYLLLFYGEKPWTKGNVPIQDPADLGTLKELFN